MKKRFLSLLLTLSLTAGLMAPALAADTAATIRLSKTTGTVSVSKSSGKSVTLLSNMRLYNGYHVATAAKSYAWMNLDDAKLVKEDASSEVEVRKNGKKLEVNIISGKVFFDVTEKLDDDESLNISTSTMIVGIRGTAGYVEVLDRWTTELTVLEGVVQCSVADPVTGQVKTEDVRGGETVWGVVYPQEQAGDKCDIVRREWTVEGTPGFVLWDVVRDMDLCDRIQADTGVDIPLELAKEAGGDPSGREPDRQTATPEVLDEIKQRLERDETDLQQRQEQVDAALREQDAGGSPDKVFVQNPASNSGGGSSGGGSSGSGVVRLTMPVTDMMVQQELDKPSTRQVVVSPGTTGSSTLDIGINMRVDAGKTLTLESGVPAQVQGSLTVDGTADLKDSLVNQAGGTVTVNSSNTLRVGGNFTSQGTFTVTATGRAIVDGFFDWGNANTFRLTPGAKVLAKDYTKTVLPPANWTWSATADASGYYTLAYSASNTMPLTDDEVQALLNGAGNITIKANADTSKNTLTIDSGLTVAAGKTLTLEPGVDIEMQASRNITVGGNMTANSIHNVSAMVTVNDGASLRLLGDLTGDAAVLRVSATGSAIIDGELNLDTTPRNFLQAKVGATVKAKTVYGSSWERYWGWSDAAADGYRTYTYTPPPFSVTLNAAGGTFSDGGNTKTVQTGDDGIVPADNWPTPARTGYAFVGWFTGSGSSGTERETDYAFVEDTTLYAHWGTGNSNWAYDETTKTLTIFSDDAFEPTPPWDSLKSDITTVTIRSGVTGIGVSAFWNCANLTSVTIPDSVTSIEDAAFQGCTSLTSVTIPSGVTNIGYYAFQGCTSLTDIYYGGTQAQWNAVTKTTDSIPSGVTVHCTDGSIVAYTVIFDPNGGTLAGDSTAVTGANGKLASLPTPTKSGSGFLGWFTAKTGGTEVTTETVFTADTTVYALWGVGNSNWAYDETNKKLIIFNDTAMAYQTSSTAIPWHSRRDDIQTVEIRNGVTKICQYAFDYCTNLIMVTIPDSVTTIDTWALSNCNKLTSVTIPDKVTSIGSRAFENNPLTSIEIPASVASIGSNAFNGCTHLTTVTFAESSNLTSIGDSAFESCTSLTDITIPDGVTSIESGTFYECNKLASVTIPASVTSIKGSAFQNCTSLTGITIPDSVTSIGMAAFRGCTSLTGITIPDGVTSIGMSAFQGCSALASVTIPDSVTSIGDYAFYGCSDLDSVTIPSGVTSIGVNAFSYCDNLTSVTILNGVTSIEDSAFQGCTSLTSVTIPASVTTIGANAFYDCQQAIKFTYGGASNQWPILMKGVTCYNGWTVSGTGWSGQYNGTGWTAQ